MSSIKYAKVIKAILEIEQHKNEIAKLKGVIRDNLTVNEFAGEAYIDEPVMLEAFNKVFKGTINLPEGEYAEKYSKPTIIRAKYVTSQVKWKSVQISLHCNVVTDARKAFSEILATHKRG